MKRAVVVLVFAALAAPAAAADVYVKVRTRTAAMAMMGQTMPATDVENAVWISATRMASVAKDSSFIVDTEKNTVFLVNHQTKSYVEAALPLDFAKLLPPEAAAMAGMMTMSATVTPTTETKTIGQWPCAGYDVTMSMMGMPLKLKVWASERVPLDVAAFQAKFMPAILQGQMRLNAASVAEFAKIKGYQIATETTGEIMGAKIQTTTEVVEMVAKPAPAGTFEPPAGYTKKATLDMADLQRR